MRKMNDELNIVQNLIHEIRGMKVMLDFDLARLYQVETKALKQAVRRNIERFPADFMFTLSQEEYKELKINIRSQFVTFNDGKGKYPKYAPFAFTEQGVAMLSSVLKSDIAIAANIAILRTFVQIRQYLQAASTVTAEIKELRARIDLLHSPPAHRLQIITPSPNPRQPSVTAQSYGRSRSFQAQRIRNHPLRRAVADAFANRLRRMAFFRNCVRGFSPNARFRCRVCTQNAQNAVFPQLRPHRP